MKWRKLVMVEQKKGKVGAFINAKVLPPIMKFVNTKAIVALKDGMVYALPFIIIIHPLVR